MALEEYRRKRDFTRTPEPAGAPAPEAGRAGAPTGADPAPASEAPAPAGPRWAALPAGHRFCVQMHRATRLHWDLRLEHRGVLLSWAVPRGPTLDPAERRLAVHVEDHPVEYGDFEGVIPSGYGAGTVLLWDIGTVRWVRESEQDPDGSLARGDLKFRLEGSKLRGEFALVRLGRRGRRAREEPEDDRNWLLIKKHDEAAVSGDDAADREVSVLSGRDLAGIAGGRDPRLRRAAGAGPRGRGAAAPPPATNAPEGATALAEDLAALIDAAPRRSLPAELSPMLLVTAARPFSRRGWVFELKFDGVRAIARTDGGRVRLVGRRGRDETRRYPELGALPDAVAAADAVLDGEIVALDERGEPSFERLQRRINVEPGRRLDALLPEVPVVFVAFDLLAAEGHDLRELPLLDRKRLLRALLRDGPAVRYADHVEEDGEGLFRVLGERGLEGMVAKDGASRYELGRRSPAWVKVRAWRTQDCAVAGYTAGRGGRGDLGALILGVREAQGDRLVHCGRVGSGLDSADIDDLRRRLEALRIDECPFVEVPPTDTAATWVKPELVVSVRHSGWTSAGTLRHPSYRGLRSDLSAGDAVREREERPDRVVAAAAARPRSRPAPPSDHPVSLAPDVEDALATLSSLGASDRWEIGGRTLRLTNLDKPLWPADGITKRAMIAYYVRAASLLLPYLRDRPVGMQVFPDGIDGKHFWRKRIPDHAPDWIRTWTYHGDRTVTYVVCDEVATLAWMANGGVIDIHPWHSRVDAPERPDWAVFDLDPFPPAGFAECVVLARLVHAALDHFGLRGYPKVTGQTGLQVYVPIERGPDQGEVRGWVEDVSRAIGRTVPHLVSWDWAVARRTGRVRLDYTQNVVGKTLAAPYSLRPAPHAPVSIPIAWEELDDPALRPDRWSIDDALDRARRTGDIFAGVLAGGQALPPAGA